MLHLIGEEEINYIFDSNASSLKEITCRAIKTYRSRPGFFTPYKNGYEFAGELIAPVVYPAFGIVTTGYSLIAAAASAVFCIGSLFVAAGATLCGAKQFRDEVLNYTGFAFQYIGIALLTAAVSALLALISFPHSFASIVTRSVATVLSLGSDSSMETSAEQAKPKDEMEIEEYKYAFQYS